MTQRLCDICGSVIGEVNDPRTPIPVEGTHDVGTVYVLPRAWLRSTRNWSDCPDICLHCTAEVLKARALGRVPIFWPARMVPSGER